MIHYSPSFNKRIAPEVPIDFTDECETTDATHVVSLVKYGLGAVFNFKRKFTHDEDRSSIEAGLSATIKIIPGIAVSGGVDVEFNETIIDILNSTTIQMFGDFSMENDQTLPTTYNESIEFFKRLPELSGSAEDGWPGTTIIEVTMSPIQNYCPSSSNVAEQINDQLMRKINSIFDELDQLEVKTDTLLLREPSTIYQPIRQNINLYKTSLKSYRLKLQKRFFR